MSTSNTPRKELRTSESEWRGTNNRQPMRRSSDRPAWTFKVKTFLKITLVIIILAALWSSYPPECRGFKSSAEGDSLRSSGSTSKQCLD